MPGLGSLRLQPTRACWSADPAKISRFDVFASGLTLTTAQRLHADMASLTTSVALLNPRLAMERQKLVRTVPVPGTAHDHLVRFASLEASCCLACAMLCAQQHGPHGASCRLQLASRLCRRPG